MDNLMVYDKDGNELHLPDIIDKFIKNIAKENSKIFEAVYLNTDGKYLEAFEAVDNGYDATDLNCFGKAINVKKITE